MNNRPTPNDFGEILKRRAEKALEENPTIKKAIDEYRERCDPIQRNSKELDEEHLERTAGPQKRNRRLDIFDRRQTLAKVSKVAPGLFSAIEKNVIERLSYRDARTDTEVAKSLGITRSELNSALKSIEGKLSNDFPGYILKRRLRIFSELTDGVEELVPNGREFNLLRAYAPVSRAGRKPKGDLLDRAAQALSAAGGIPYGNALIELTKTRHACAKCAEPLPYLRKSDPLHKLLPPELHRKRRFCSASCRVSNS